MTQGISNNEQIKMPLENIINQDPLSLLKDGKTLEAELSEEHKLFFTHLDTMNYIRENKLSPKLQLIYTNLILDLLKNIIIPNTLDYLSLGTSKLSSEDIIAYFDLMQQKYSIFIHVSTNFFYESCREHIKIMKEKGTDVSEAESILS